MYQLTTSYIYIIRFSIFILTNCYFKFFWSNLTLDGFSSNSSKSATLFRFFRNAKNWQQGFLFRSLSFKCAAGRCFSGFGCGFWCYGKLSKHTWRTRLLQHFWSCYIGTSSGKELLNHQIIYWKNDKRQKTQAIQFSTAPLGLIVITNSAKVGSFLVKKASY